MKVTIEKETAFLSKGILIFDEIVVIDEMNGAIRNHRPSRLDSKEFLTKKLQYFQGQGARVYGAKAHDHIANQCVYTFAVCLGNHTQFVLRDSDDGSAPRSSLTLLGVS